MKFSKLTVTNVSHFPSPVGLYVMGILIEE